MKLISNSGYADEVVDYFERVDCFNMEKQFIDLCSRLVIEHIDSEYKSTIRPCCVNCEGTDCAAMRKYFRSSPLHQTIIHTVYSSNIFFKSSIPGA